MENTLHQNDFRRSDSPEEVYYSNPGRKTYYIACCPGMYIPEILLQLHCPVQEVRKYNQTALFPPHAKLMSYVPPHRKFRFHTNDSHRS